MRVSLVKLHLETKTCFANHSFEYLTYGLKVLAVVVMVWFFGCLLPSPFLPKASVLYFTISETN